MRLDWQVALKNAISAVKTANGLTERDEFVVRAPQGTTQQLTLPSASASSSFGAAGTSARYVGPSTRPIVSAGPPRTPTSNVANLGTEVREFRAPGVGIALPLRGAES